MKTSFSHLQNNTHATWYKDPCLRRNALHCMVISLAVYYIGYDQNLLNGLQALPRWKEYFNSPSGAILGFCTASIFFPAIITCFVGDWIAGTYGRKWSLRIGAVLIIIGSFVNAFAKDFDTFIGSRWIIGAGGGISKVAGPAWLHEIAHPRIRASAGATYYAFAYLGGIFAAWICFGSLYIQSEWSWRFPTIFQIAGPIIVIAASFDIPESPRFLMKKGRTEEAINILAKYHANGSVDDELVQYEILEIQKALEAENLNKQVSYLDFLKTAANRRRLFVICVISIGTNWLGNGVVSYYLSPILKLVGVTKPVEVSAINGCLAIWNLIISATVAQFVDRIGRRPLWLISTGGMLCSYVIITALSATFARTQEQGTGLAVVPFLFIFFGFYVIAWTIQCYSYTTEILPYNMRTKGLAIFVCVQNGALAFNTYVNPIALKAIAWKYYLVYIATASIWFIIIYFTFPEIKGLTIEEISLVFDQGRMGNKKAVVEEMTSDMRIDEATSKDGYEDSKGGVSNTTQKV
ncbi:general substrate transporter [Cystobasidium minutum MCA 4210]|uniref:general substrate transporter n=1 Tax=Cystobasidium minutum MCA 4210 TaxID=1397322 RepID=UPI0034CDA50E|eukprot:jgi/Rhomi1/175059/fgenesh1_kg.9_\